MPCYKELDKFKYGLCLFNALVINIVLYLTPVLVALLISNNFSSDNFILFIIISMILNCVYLLCNHIWMVPVNNFLMSFEKKQMLSYFKRIVNVSFEKLNEIHTGYLKKQLDMVITNSNMFLRSIMDNVIGCIVSGTIFLITTFIQSKKLFIFVFIMLVIIIIYNLKISKIHKKRQKNYNNDYSNYNARVTDILQNIKTIKKLDADYYAESKIDESFEPARISFYKLKIMNSIRFNGIDATIFIMYFIILISLYFKMKSGDNVLPFLLFYITSFEGIKNEFRRLSNVFQVYTELKSATEQVEDMVGYYETKDKVKSFNKIDINNVRFKYDMDSKKEIVVPSFTLNKKDKISIIGKSGEGKTTFLNILSKFLVDDDAIYLIDGKDIDKNLDLAFISQDVDLLNVSIKENICLGKKISSNKYIELLKDADMYDFINELPQGDDTIVGERGVKLSAGQKQRINILRGIVLDKELYILDEPTSNLDMETESLIINLINKHLKDKTVVIVTHRMRLKDICNKHYVFEKGVMQEEK